MTTTETRMRRPIDLVALPMEEQIGPFTVHEGLAIYRFGSGQPLLLMPYPHAWNLVGTPNFTTLVDGLTQLGRTVITFDPPGAGRSTRPMRLDMPEMLECAEEALATCGVDGPVDVVGHSMGSYAALAFAIEHPVRVRRLVLVGAGAGGTSYIQAPGALWNASHPRFRRWALFAALYWLSGRRAPEKLMSNVVTRASYFDPACAPQQAVELRDWLRPARPRTRWGNVARKLDYRPRLGDIRAPTLLLVGRRDPQMPPACAEELAQGIPHAQLVVFDHSGHYPFVEEPEPFWAAVGAFLAPEPVVEARHTGADGRPDARRPERPDRADLSVPGRPRQVALTAEVMAPARQDGGLL